MSGPSSIEWTERTWNPIVGCSVVSPGCTNCYAMRMAARIERMGGAPHYAGLTTKAKAGPVFNGKVALAPESVLLAPLRRRKPTIWFVNSMGDLFHESVPDAWIDRVFAVMALAPQHTFQVLTKRSARMRAYMLEKWQGTPAQTLDFGNGDVLHVPAGGETGRMHQVETACEEFVERLGLADPSKDALWTEDGKCKAMQWRWPLPNVWLGVSAEDQRRYDEREADLRATPAAVRFFSIEPMLGSIDMRLPRVHHHPDNRASAALDALVGAALAQIGGWLPDWIIVGGESGPGARPMHPDWARSIRDQCAAAGVPFFFKQWGTWKDGSDFVFGDSVKAVLTDGRVLSADRDSLYAADRDDPVMRKNPTLMRCVGKKAAGRLLDGVEHNAMPGRAP